MEIPPPYAPDLKDPYDTSCLKRHTDLKKIEKQKRIDLMNSYEPKEIEIDNNLFKDF